MNLVFIVALFLNFYSFFLMYFWPSGFETFIIMNCRKLRAACTCIIPSLEWLILEVLIATMEWNIRDKEEITEACSELHN